MADIFLSYANVDLPRIQPLIQAFEQRGWSVWWDQTIPPGQTYDEVIQKALDEARCVMVVWSLRAVKSTWVLDEATEGRNREVLIPAMIDEVRVPLGFRRIEAARLLDWQGEAAQPEFEQLMQAVTTLIGPPPQQTAPRIGCGALYSLCTYISCIHPS